MMARGGDLAAMQADQGGDAEVAARRGGLLVVLVQDVDLGHRVIPPARVEQQLAQRAARLRQPDDRADLDRKLPGLLRRRERLLVAVEAAQDDGLVDPQEQLQVGERRIGLSDARPRT